MIFFASASDGKTTSAPRSAERPTEAESPTWRRDIFASTASTDAGGGGRAGSGALESSSSFFASSALRCSSDHTDAR
eukprot:25594-Pelagococcus_subviridis.AAC.1